MSLADAVRAYAQLRPQDDATRSSIRRLLGLELGKAPDLPRCVGPWSPSVRPPPRLDAFAPAPDEIAAPPAEAAPNPPLEFAALPATLESAGTVAFRPPSWVGAPVPLPAVASARSRRPLLERGRARAILATALAGWVREGALDMEAAIRAVVAARPLQSLPRLPVRTLRHGAQVLVDRSPAMDPFRADVRQLLAEIERLFGSGHWQRLWFAYCPGRGVGPGRREEWTAWRPFRDGSPVLVVSDLSRSPPRGDERVAGTGEWLAFVRRVHAARCPLVLLVPFEASRWPPALPRAAAMVHWSERTTAREVGRVKREARRVRG